VSGDPGEARVIDLPRGGPTPPAARAARWDVDGWGRDSRLVGLTVRIGRLRWSATIDGERRLPARRGALVIVNARRYALTPLFTALALGEATGRVVRFAGRPDVVPFGPVLRRLGGLLDRPDEVRGALRAGELVVLGARPQLHPRRVGRVDHQVVGVAIETRTSVFPAATLMAPVSGQARIRIGSAARAGRRRRGPLSELELADVVERRIQRLLDELGGAQTGTLLDWVPLGVAGG
jgi:hypothetical protein